MYFEGRIVDVKKIVDEMFVEDRKIYIDGDYIVVNVKYPYEIPLSSCNTPGRILGWMRQLSEKNWMTAPRLYHFTRLAFEQIGIELENI